MTGDRRLHLGSALLCCGKGGLRLVESSLLLGDVLLGGLDGIAVVLAVGLCRCQSPLGNREGSIGLVHGLAGLRAGDVAVLLGGRHGIGGWPEELGTASHDGDGGQSAGKTPVGSGHVGLSLRVSKLRRDTVRWESDLLRTSSISKNSEVSCSEFHVVSIRYSQLTMKCTTKCNMTFSDDKKSDLTR